MQPLLEAADAPAELGRWRGAGRLRRDEQPALYLLELTDAPGAPPVRFLLCALAGASVVPLEHEPPLLRSAHVEPALTLVADDHGLLRDLLAQASTEAPVAAQGTLGGRLVALRRVEAPALTKRLQGVVEEAPLRPLAALPERGQSLAAVVPLTEPGLRLHPVHRALRALPTYREETFLQLVSAYARVYELDEPLTRPGGLAAARERLATLVRGQHAVLLVLPGGRGKILRFRQGLDLAHLKAAPKSPTLRSLDLALLNALVLRTVLGLQEPEAVDHPHVVPVARLEELVAQVDAGVFQAGFALNPPPLWEIRAVMEAGATLPPRTLQATPLPPPGLLFLDPEG